MTKHVLSPQPKTHDKNWLSPTNRIAILRAVRSQHKTVKLVDSRTLEIDYDSTNRKVYIHPPKGYGLVPCGWFDIDKITNEDWLME